MINSQHSLFSEMSVYRVMTLWKGIVNKSQYCIGVLSISLPLQCINPFSTNVPLLYPLKTSVGKECFQGGTEVEH